MCLKRLEKKEKGNSSMSLYIMRVLYDVDQLFLFNTLVEYQKHWRAN
jgi:hypothetical protein